MLWAVSELRVCRLCGRRAGRSQVLCRLLRPSGSRRALVAPVVVWRGDASSALLLLSRFLNASCLTGVPFFGQTEFL